MGLASRAGVRKNKAEETAAGERSWRGRKRWVLVVLAALFFLGGRAAPVRAAQTGQQQQPGTIPGQPSMQPSMQPGMQPNPLDNGIDPATSARMQEQRQHALEDDRRRRIVADANKLLALATELKAEVDKSSKNEMSIAVIDKAGQIEKLSHDLKERMKN